jgi:threonine/homoserine/homoserine lactone efflux protein
MGDVVALTSVLTFVGGCAAVLAVPGPNMMALGGLAALRGFRGAVPMSLGIAAGATTLAAAIEAASMAVSGIPGKTAVEFAGAALLLLVAVYVMRLRPDVVGQRYVRTTPIVEFGAGFCTALTNPITAGYFAAELGSHLQRSLVPTAAALVAIPVVALLACLSLSRCLTSRSARRIVQAWHLPIRLATTTLLVAMAGLILLRQM